MNNSILQDVKMHLGICSDYENFDMQIIDDINTILFILNQMGIGIKNFRITSDSERWVDFLGETGENKLCLSAIKDWSYLKVRMMFDPPTNSIVLNSMNEVLKELEWRMYITENYIGEI